MYNYARLAYRDGNTREAIRYLQKSVDVAYHDDPETLELPEALKKDKKINLI